MSSTTRKRPRRFTLDATSATGSNRTLTLADLERFMADNEAFAPRLRSVTFELDDAVTDHS
ncbi:hypothetical protein [Halomarina litorea]|uniref:hypothetical protein n=1 Tax=Halomarina litorea TaxID=2961595 RepID=UPI0020C5AEEC|nr:hypothetical protein [Halomarina sp. BCD28]